MHGMNYIGRVISNFKDFYNDINGATLTGAIDVIVVEQPDGTYNCSPFHVRFGKLGVLRSKEKVVDIEINGEPQDIHMKLGESGEAFFVEELEDSEDNEIPEHLATSPITVSEFEKIFKSQDRRRSLDLGIDPTIEKVVENETNTYTKRRNTTDNENSKTYRERDFIKRQLKLGNIDLTENCDDLTLSSTLSLQSATKAPSSDDLTQDVSETIFKMDSLDVDKTEDLSEKSKTGKRRRRKTKKKNAPRKSSSNNHLQEISIGGNIGDLGKDKSSDSITDRSSLDSTNSESELSKGATKAEENSTSSGRKVIDPEFHFFSDTELTAGGNVDSRGTTPVLLESVQSDSEIEVKNRKEDSAATSGQSWEWGSFPKNQVSEAVENQVLTKEEEQKMSMISSMFSFMKTKHQETHRSLDGVYLSDISSGNIDPDKAGLYFTPIRDKTGMNDGDMDCESGNGPSLAQSPNSNEGSKSIDSDFDDQNKLAQLYMNDISISICGWEPEPNADRFLEHVVSFSDMCNNPSMLENPNMVFRIRDKYYNWKVAAPLITSLMIYHRPLPQSSVEQLCSLHMPIPANQLDKNKSKPQENRQYSWWSWRRGRSSRETTPVLETSDEAKVAAENEEEQKDEEKISEDTAFALDAALKENQIEITVKPAISEESQSPKSTSEKYKKTLRLSSKQITSLNLKNGVNEVEFSVTTAYQGTSRCKCYLYKWKWDDKIVISDIDGTITKSDVLGHILPVIGKDWAQNGVAQLFNKIANNGYKLLYLSARAIGQARTTREYLRSIRQGDLSMPDGPVLLNPTSLISAFHREVIEKKPEAFKISCMADIKTLFPSDANPFYAGYGNRVNDVWAYRAVGIPIVRIFTINPKGELKHELTQTFQSSYSGQSLVVNDVFPALPDKIKNFDSDSDEIDSDLDTSDLEY